jgi:AcrR family transcriptional regulator
MKDSHDLVAVKLHFDSDKIAWYFRTMTAQAPEKQKYHHGDLRQALLDAAEAEIAEAGIESFSLRRVAKRAGVSHAAPAHHFGDARGLLTALAAEGYRRFVATQQAREMLAGADPRDILLASGLGYIAFAEANPALFRLIFASDRPDAEDPELGAAGRAAFDHLCDNIAAVTGVSPFDDDAAMHDALSAWGMSHGLADLLVSGRMKPLQQMPAPQRDAVLAAIIARALPRGK